MTFMVQRLTKLYQNIAKMITKSHAISLLHEDNISSYCLW